MDDRGWTTSAGVGCQTAAEVEQTARVVVGPDEPAPGWTRAQTEANHWVSLENRLREAGIDVASVHLSAMPHDVEIGESLRRLLKLG